MFSSGYPQRMCFNSLMCLNSVVHSVFTVNAVKEVNTNKEKKQIHKLSGRSSLIAASYEQLPAETDKIIHLKLTSSTVTCTWSNRGDQLLIEQGTSCGSDGFGFHGCKFGQKRAAATGATQI